MNPSNISNICDISGEASVNVYKFLKQGAQFGVKYPPNNPVLQLFSNFINKIKNSKKCNVCQFVFLITDVQFCPSCGSDDWVTDLLFNYNNLSMLSTQEADYSVTNCPRCHNNIINNQANYCEMCGTFLHNQCSGFKGFDRAQGKETIKWHMYEGGCGQVLAADYKYCHHCGSTSTYLVDGIFDD